MKKNTPKVHKQSLKVSTVIIIRKSIAFINAHTVVIIVVIAGVAIGMALFQSHSLLNPSRNEAHYEELAQKNKYGKVDFTLVNKLQKSLNDKNIVVNPELAPNRKNPFTE